MLVHQASARSRRSHRGRCANVDLNDKDVQALMGEHIRADQCTKALLWPYSKTRHAQGPSWPELYRHRALLGDLIALSGGRLLRLVAWEASLKYFLNQTCKKDFSDDEITYMARKPRLMMSHLWNSKRRGVPIPARFRQLAQLRDAMNVPADQMTAAEDIGDSQDEMSKEDSDVAPIDVILASQASAVTVASTDVGADCCNDQDLDQLLSEITHTDAIPASGGGSSSAGLSEGDIASFLAKCTAVAPSQAAYKEAFKKPAAKPRKRPAAAKKMAFGGGRCC